jgi:hypothetical protein
VTTDAPEPLTGQEGAALANQIEGFLLAEAERARARREAEDFCGLLPWLTTAQAEDLAGHYAEQRLELTRQMLRRTVDRAAELRCEYQARYDQLRRRLLTYHTVCACLLVVCCSLVCLASR